MERIEDWRICCLSYGIYSGEEIGGMVQKEEDQEAYGARQSGLTKNINKLSSNDDDLSEML